LRAGYYKTFLEYLEEKTTKLPIEIHAFELEGFLKNSVRPCVSV